MTQTEMLEDFAFQEYWEGVDMTELEKVIKGLGIVSRMLNEMGRRNEMDIVDDAIELLKEQEAVAPEKEHSGSGITWWNVCGNCKTAINPNDKYCHECGKRIEWEGR